MARKKTPQKPPPKTHRAAMRLSPALVHRLDVVAIRKGLSRTKLVEELLREALKMKEAEPSAALFE